MKAGVGDIIGKTITDVIVAENVNTPNQRVFLVFSDNTYFEFYGSFGCTSGVNRGGLHEAMQYAGKMGGSITSSYPAKE